MKKGILTLAVLASISSMAAVAAEEEAPDMSDPTAVYTTLGFGYGNQGLDLSSMLLLSSTETQKTGLIFDVKNMLNEDDKVRNPINGHEVNNTSYRLRWGSINTQNGLGTTIDVVNLEHPGFGRMTVAQAGALATLPIGDNFLLFPIAFVGGVLVEDNTLELLNAAPDMTYKAVYEGAIKQGAPEAAAKAAAEAKRDELIKSEAYQMQVVQATGSSEGMAMASTIATGMVYARYAFTEKLWALGSYAYTKDIQGKSWSDDALEGGLQMPSQMYDITIGYQITPTQNITAFYGSDNSSSTDDKWKIGYNYAF